MAQELILEAARTIRAYLSELLGEEQAAVLDRELADLLARAGTDPTAEEQIIARLGEPPAVAEWTAAFLDGGRPPEVRDLVEQAERYAGLPGHGEPPPPPARYVCPEGDFVRWRRGAEPLPKCPTHHLPLQRADR